MSKFEGVMDDDEIVIKLSVLVAKYGNLANPIIRRAMQAGLVSIEERDQLKAFADELQGFLAEVLASLVNLITDD